MISVEPRRALASGLASPTVVPASMLPCRLIAPLAHAVLKRRSPYYRYPGRYADPWGVIDAKWESHK